VASEEFDLSLLVNINLVETPLDWEIEIGIGLFIEFEQSTN
jgi:hypothetical protein